MQLEPGKPALLKVRMPFHLRSATRSRAEYPKHYKKLAREPGRSLKQEALLRQTRGTLKLLPRPHATALRSARLPAQPRRGAPSTQPLPAAGPREASPGLSALHGPGPHTKAEPRTALRAARGRHGSRGLRFGLPLSGRERYLPRWRREARAARCRAAAPPCAPPRHR